MPSSQPSRHQQHSQLRVDVRTLSVVQLHKLAQRGSKSARAELERRMRAADAAPPPPRHPASPQKLAPSLFEPPGAAPQTPRTAPSAPAQPVRRASDAFHPTEIIATIPPSDLYSTPPAAPAPAAPPARQAPVAAPQRVERTERERRAAEEALHPRHPSSALPDTRSSAARREAPPSQLREERETRSSRRRESDARFEQSVQHSRQFEPSVQHSTLSSHHSSSKSRSSSRSNSRRQRPDGVPSRPLPLHIPQAGPDLQGSDEHDAVVAHLAAISKQEAAQTRANDVPRFIGMVIMAWAVIVALSGLVVLASGRGAYFLFSGIAAGAVGWLLFKLRGMALPLHAVLLLAAFAWAWSGQSATALEALIQSMPLLIPAAWMFFPQVREPLQ